MVQPLLGALNAIPHWERRSFSTFYINSVATPFPFFLFIRTKCSIMIYDVLVVGGGSAGLSALMCLGRALMKVLCIDLGKPCNRFADHSHNFLTNDGKKPGEILLVAKLQLAAYDTVELVSGTVASVIKKETHFEAEIASDKGDLKVETKKIIFASGIKDLVDDVPIKNFSKYWGVSVFLCPYCHGYEYKHKKTGLLFDNSQFLQMLAPRVYNWSKDLVLFSKPEWNQKEGPDMLEKFKSKKIQIIDTKIDSFIGDEANGLISGVKLVDGSIIELSAVYAIPRMELNNEKIIRSLGCEIDEQSKLVKVDAFQKTNVPGVFVCGDACTRMRSIATAAYQGTFAGAMVSHELTDEVW